MTRERCLDLQVRARMQEVARSWHTSYGRVLEWLRERDGEGMLGPHLTPETIVRIRERFAACVEMGIVDA